jgi:hypothetical protein
MIGQMLRGFLFGIGFCLARAVWQHGWRIMAAGVLWWILSTSFRRLRHED